MASNSFTNRSLVGSSQQTVAITSVDTIGLVAIGLTRQQTRIDIDLRYLVGSVHVIPSVGDQWIICRYASGWVLQSQLPYNGTEMLTAADNPVQGLTQVGSTNPNGQGPLHLNGSIVAVNAPIVVQSTSTADRPAASVGVGAHVFDTTLSKPIWSDGTAWRDAAGSVV